MNELFYKTTQEMFDTTKKNIQEMYEIFQSHNKRFSETFSNREWKKINKIVKKKLHELECDTNISDNQIINVFGVEKLNTLIGAYDGVSGHLCCLRSDS